MSYIITIYNNKTEQDMELVVGDEFFEDEGKLAETIIEMRNQVNNKYEDS